MTQETVQEMKDMDLPQVQNHLHLLQSINTCCSHYKLPYLLAIQASTSDMQEDVQETEEQVQPSFISSTQF